MGCSELATNSLDSTTNMIRLTGQALAIAEEVTGYYRDRRGNLKRVSWEWSDIESTPCHTKLTGTPGQTRIFSQLAISFLLSFFLSFGYKPRYS